MTIAVVLSALAEEELKKKAEETSIPLATLARSILHEWAKEQAKKAKSDPR